ncbi:MAG: YczE/YyaS/YitT family protein [Actinomycetota bacterium]
MRLTFPRPRIPQLARYLAGITVVSVAAALGIRSGVGAAPYDALLATISEISGASFWLSAWGLQGVWITLILGMRGRFDLGTVFHSLSFGPIMSATLALVPPAGDVWLSLLYLAVAVGGIAFGLWLYLGAGFVAGTIDTLFETVSARRRWRPATVRTTFDVTCCAVAWLGSGPVGVGTVVIALGVGPLLAAMDSGLARPGSWRGVPLGRRGRVPALTLDLVDTTEYPVLPRA